MDFIFILVVVALILAIINAILLTIRMADKRISVGKGLLIIIGSAFGPYCLALLFSSFAKGWDRMGWALVIWVFLGFISMTALFIYLISLKKEVKRNEELGSMQ